MSPALEFERALEIWEFEQSELAIRFDWEMSQIERAYCQ
jgi:hypothetical protein